MGNWFSEPEPIRPPPTRRNTDYLREVEQELQNLYYSRSRSSIVYRPVESRRFITPEPRPSSTSTQPVSNRRESYVEARPRINTLAPRIENPWKTDPLWEVQRDIRRVHISPKSSIVSRPPVESPRYITPTPTPSSTSTQPVFYQRETYVETRPRINTVAPRIENPLCKMERITSSNDQFIFDGIRDMTESLNWDSVSYTNQPVHFIRLDPNSTEYIDLKRNFRKTNKKCFVIDQIERIQNPYLLAAFLLKQNEMDKRTGDQSIENLFHGTDGDKVYNICTNNFDWRLYGKNVGSKFGRGISFTPISHYAAHYGNEGSSTKVMLVVLTLIGKESVGTVNMVLPPAGIDTTTKEDRHVIVKYEDNEFYPAYKITYTCNNPVELRLLNNKQHYRRRRRRS